MKFHNQSLNYSYIDSLSEWKNVLSNNKFTLNSDLFQIEHCFFKKVNTRKRKKPTDDFSELESFHETLHKILNDFQLNYLRIDKIVMENNVEVKFKNENAKLVSKEYLNHTELIDTCFELTKSNQLHVDDDKFKYFHKIIKNSSSDWKVIDVLSRKYFMPQFSGFIMSDIRFADKLLRSLNSKFDFIVIDPPVRNKSVKYSNAYGFLDELELLELPVRHLMNKDCIVAVWCTNSAKSMESVESCLFRAWGIRFKALCNWLKITKSGQSVLDIDDRFRRPYEKLFLGRAINDQISSSRLDADPLGDLDEHVILSVPCSLHSAKPNLQNFMSKYLPENPQCLELFARNLYPGWMSWGNEPLKFLVSDIMVPKVEDSPVS